jgi:CDC45-like protein
LKSDEMQYNSIPVFSNIHLLEELKKLTGNQHVRSLIFINCGGLIDQTSQWYYSQESEVQSFVFDAHRPFHHNNIIDVARKICIVHDGC